MRSFGYTHGKFGTGVGVKEKDTFDFAHMITVYCSIAEDFSNIYYLRDSIEEGIWSISSDLLFHGTKRVKCKHGDKIEIFPGHFLEVLSSPNDPKHFMFLIENNLFTGVVDSNNPLIQTLSKGRYCYPEVGMSWKG